MTVYDFARKCMKDPEFNCGGIPKNERKCLDAIGFDYSIVDGCMCEGEDLYRFYQAMCTLKALNDKYKKE